MMTQSTTEGVKVYRLRLTLESPLAIGAGVGGFTREILRAPIFWDGELRRLPIIPSTTLRGALRGIAESIAQPIVAKSDRPVDLWDAIMASHRRDGGLTTHSGLEDREDEIRSKILEEGYDESDIEALGRRYASLLCPICRLFGAPGVASALKLSDAIPEIPDIRSEFLPRVALDRKRLKAAERRLFREEVLLPGLSFSAILLLDFRGFEGAETTKRSKRLFEFVLNVIRETGLQVGGGKSIGRGLLKVELT